jgi:hypothetical protein
MNLGEMTQMSTKNSLEIQLNPISLHFKCSCAREVINFPRDSNLFSLRQIANIIKSH